MIIGIFILVSAAVVLWAVYTAFLSPEASAAEKRLQKEVEELEISNTFLKQEREKLTQQIFQGKAI